MASEFEFHARLFSRLEDFISTHDTDFNSPSGEEQTESGRADIFIPSDTYEGIAIEVKKADVDPHSYDVIQQGHRYAVDKNISLFATANKYDVFLFRRTDTATSVTELDRRHYDLRRLSLDDFIEEFLADVVELQKGTGVAFNFDDLIVSRLRSFHTSISPIYRNIIKQEFDEKSEFQSKLEKWARENDYPSEYPGLEDTFQIAAQQYAYLLMNRIVFYELVRSQDVETESGFPLDPIYGDVTLDRLDDHLEDCFESIVEEIDYEAIFENDNTFFNDIPDNDHTRDRLQVFTRSVEQEPLQDIEVDVIGQIYQELIPVKERKELGQFYTPDEIGQMLSRWAIQDSSDRFLDPASGSGSITVEAYKRLDSMGELSHREIIQQITAVDINKFPLHLTALNLATRNIHEPTNELFAYHENFFDLDPDTLRLNSTQLGVGGSGEDTTDPNNEAIGKFDATAANPPYVEQEHLYPNREHFREHLKEFGSSSNYAYYNGDKEIDGRSDLYCYFLTHVTSFLKEGARLAWIVPTKWMVADYGPSLQEFLYDHYKVEAVVGFRKRVFDDALVDTVLLMLERHSDTAERQNTETNFVRINQQMDTDDVIDVIDREYGVDDDSYMKLLSRPNYRVVSVNQSHLMENIGDNIHHYINAPTLYTTVLENSDMTELSDKATITRGQKTGANSIFILDEDDINSRNVEERFVRPAVKSVKEVEGYEHTSADAVKWMLDVNEYVQEVVASSDVTGTSDTESRVLSSLRRDGYDGVHSYLKWADNQPSRTNKSIQDYEPWFNMGSLDPKQSPIVCPQAMDTRRFFFRTDGEVVSSNRFLLIQPNRGTDVRLLLGLLNTSLTKIVIESHGRVTGGGAINLSGSDLRTLRVVDPDALTDQQAAELKEGFKRLLDGDESGRNRMDQVVIDVLDLSVTVKQLQKIAKGLKMKRREKGQSVETLIKELDELEGQIEMNFEDDEDKNGGGRQQNLGEL